MIENEIVNEVLIVANIIIFNNTGSSIHFAIQKSDGRVPREGRNVDTSKTSWAESQVSEERVVDDEKCGGSVVTGAHCVECCSDVRRRGVDRFDSIDEGSRGGVGAHIRCRVGFVDDDFCILSESD